MGSYRDPTWPPGSDELEALAAAGHVRRTFLRLAPERRQLVLDAALEEAAEHGLGSLSIKAVAARAQVPVGSLYQYFGDRGSLVGLICVLVAQRLASILAYAAPMLAKLPLEEGLSQLLAQSIEWCRDESVLMRIYSVAAYSVAFRRDPLPDESEDPDVMLVSAMGRSMQGISGAMVAAASRRNELREDLDLDEASRILNVLLIAVTDAALLPGINAYYRLYDSRHGQKRMMQAAVDFACRGLLRGTEESAPATPRVGKKGSVRPGRRSARRNRERDP